MKLRVGRTLGGEQGPPQHPRSVPCALWRDFWGPHLIPLCSVVPGKPVLDSSLSSLLAQPWGPGPSLHWLPALSYSLEQHTETAQAKPSSGDREVNEARHWGLARGPKPAPGEGVRVVFERRGEEASPGGRERHTKNDKAGGCRRPSPSSLGGLWASLGQASQGEGAYPTGR